MPTVHPTKGLIGRRSAKMPWAVFLLYDPETLQTYEEYAREFFYEAERDQPPHLPTPLTAGTITKRLRLLAKGELHNRTKAKRGPLQGPQEWTLTKTPRSRELLRARSSTTASHPPLPETRHQRTPPGESIRRTSLPPSTRSLKKHTTPTSTPTISPRHPRPPKTHKWQLMRQQQRQKMKHMRQRQLLRQRQPTQWRHRQQPRMRQHS